MNNFDDGNLSTSLHEVSKSIGSIRSGANNNSMHQYLMQRSMSSNSSFISHADGNSTSGTVSSPPHPAMIASSPLQNSFSQALRAPRAMRPDETSDPLLHESPTLSNVAGSTFSPGNDTNTNSPRIGGGARRMLTEYGKRVMERRAAEAEAAAPVSVEPSIESNNALHVSSNTFKSKKHLGSIKRSSTKPISFSPKAFHTPKKSSTDFKVSKAQMLPSPDIDQISSTRPEVDAGDHKPKLRPSFEFEYDVIGPLELPTVSQINVNTTTNENIPSSHSMLYSQQTVKTSPSKMMTWFGQQRQIPGFFVPQVSEFSPSALLFEQQQQHMHQQRLDTVLEGASPVTSEGTRQGSTHKSQYVSSSTESLGSCSTRTLPVPDIPVMALRSLAGPFFTKKVETYTQNKVMSKSPHSLTYTAAPPPQSARKPAVPTFSQSPSKKGTAWVNGSENDMKKPLSPYAAKLTTHTKRTSPNKKTASHQQQQYDYRIQTAFGKTRVERVPTLSAAVPFVSPASPPNARVRGFSERMTSQPDFSSTQNEDGVENVSTSGGTVLGVEAAYDDFERIKAHHPTPVNDVDLESGEQVNSRNTVVAANSDEVVIDIEDIYDKEYGISLSPRHGVDAEIDEDDDELSLPSMPQPPILRGATWNEGATAPKRTPSKVISSKKAPILPVASTWTAVSSSTALFVDAPKAVVLETPRPTTTSRTPLTSRYSAPVPAPRQLPFTTSTSSSNFNMMNNKKSIMKTTSSSFESQRSPFTPSPGAKKSSSSPLSSSPYAKKASFTSSSSKLSGIDAKERAQRLRVLSGLIQSNQGEYAQWMWNKAIGRAEGV